MTRPNTAASSSPERGQQQPGEARAANTPVWPPLDYPVRTRFVRDNPELRARAYHDDEIANALRWQLLEPSRLERFSTWAAVGLVTVVGVYFAAQFLRLAL